MEREQIVNDLEDLAKKVFNPANSWAVKDAVSRLCQIFENVNPGVYADMYKRFYFVGSDAAKATDYDVLTSVENRLEKLAIRLHNEGLHVDSNICFLALEKLQKGVDGKADSD